MSSHRTRRNVASLVLISVVMLFCGLAQVSSLNAEVVCMTDPTNYPLTERILDNVCLHWLNNNTAATSLFNGQDDRTSLQERPSKLSNSLSALSTFRI